MTTYNTGNPIGSKDPRDLYDNAENLDAAVNDRSTPTWKDRLGIDRLTWKGIEQVGTGDSGVAVDAASRALASASEARNSEVAAKVSEDLAWGYARSSQSDASRAEAARDSATVSADVYPTISAGLAATSNGQQFQVVTGDVITRYRNNGGAAVVVAQYPTAEIILSAGFPTATEEINWNTISRTGFYRGSPLTDTTIGAPTGNAYLTLVHIQGQGQSAFQLASRNGSHNFQWTRTRGVTSPEWSPWSQLLTGQVSTEQISDGSVTNDKFPRAEFAPDWNVIEKTGFYRGSSKAGETIGAPTTNPYMTVFHLQGGLNAAMQIASQSSNAASAKRWMRSRSATSGEWGEWVEIKTSGSTGEFDPIATQALDWNVITKSGFYRGSSNVGQTVGAPATNAYLNLLHIQGQGKAAFQLASTSGSAIPRQWVRSRTVQSGGEWSEWSELVKGDQAPTPQGLMPGGLYRENSAIKVIRPESQFYGQTATNIYNNSATELHGHYDQMIADFPDYVSKELLGQDNFGNDIFEYTFAAPPLRGKNHTVADKAHPKIVVVNAVHPDEKYSIVGNLCFFDDLCRNWQQDERLADLRWGAKIVLLAVANPSGVNANTRLNAAGVNIGRNLSFDWENNDSPDKGPGPLSEPESQYIAQLAVRHPEACAFIDHHGHAGQHLTWIGARLDKAFTIAKHTARINGAWCRRFVPGLYDDNSITAVTSTVIGGPACEWAEVFGKNAFLLESAETTGWSGLSRRDNQRVIVESLLCLIHENWRRESETRGYVDP